MLGVLGLKIKGDPKLMLGDAAASMSDTQIKTEIESRFEWLLIVAILSGSLLRLNFGIWSDIFGGRNLMVMLLIGCAIPTAWLAYAQSYTELILCAALFGLAGNSFSIGVAWNSAWFPSESRGTALGIFGAGNVGASVTKLLVVLAPGILSLTAGGWRLVPLIYAAMLVVIAVAIVVYCPTMDPKPGRGRPFRDLIAPLKYVRVWRFSLYYVVVFGAYVALSVWLPNYYVTAYGLDLRTASLHTALFIFPASLLRPLGGWLSDKYGPRLVTFAVFVGMLLALIPLCLPPDVLCLSVEEFSTILFVVGIGMGIGKASVFKYIPNYFPQDVGAVGGLVGMLGALGGFFLPKMFGWLGRETGFPQAAFLSLLALTLASFVWLQVAVRAQRSSLVQVFPIAK